MATNLEEHIRNCGLGGKWMLILKDMGIDSDEDLQQKLSDKNFHDELRQAASFEEEEALSRLIKGETLQGDTNSTSPENVMRKDDNQCLKLYFQNSGLEAEYLCKMFANKGISTLKELQSLVNEKEQFWEFLDSLRGIDKDNFKVVVENSLNAALEHQKILDNLGLLQYFPEKITLQNAIENSSRKLVTLHDVPWYFLSKILMLDYRARDDHLPESLENEKQNKKANDMQELEYISEDLKYSDADEGSDDSQESENSDDDLDELLAKVEDTAQRSKQAGLHPMDVLIAVFQCSSNCLRQILCEKMFVCKLSIPFVLPHFLNSTSKVLLWSLRSIVLECKTSSGEFNASSLVNSSAPVVSCIRLGEVSRSKSNLLNEIINGKSHNTYFHRDCKNGMMEKKLSKGLIETALFLPSANTSMKDQFNDVTMIANLRGDGLVQVEQRHFLLKFSDVVIVMVDVGDLEKPDVISITKSITSTNTDVFFMLSNSVPEFEQCRKILSSWTEKIKGQSFRTTNIILDFMKNGEKNIKELKSDIVKKVNKALKKKTRVGKTLKDRCKVLAESVHMTVDENTSDFQSCQEKALDLVQEIEKQNTGENKAQKLPLQSKPWQDWAKLNKEEHRLTKKDPGKSVVEYVADLHSRKREKRKEQFEYLEKPHKFFEMLLDSLKTIKRDDRLYYVKFLKLYLDELSRESLPKLKEEHSLKMDEKALYDNDNIPKELRDEISRLAKRISDASFGMEHLIREIGQAYEVIADMKSEVAQSMYDNIGCFPQIVAEMMLDGYPLELMDGDASHVPLLWIMAVLTELENILGDKKIFVLSVLGVQSSGKSTMLNTMFGLQLTVAAGRCTRGVYAQLVPFGKQDPSMNYDYILVIDTEGLRAPELGQGFYQHDNEIATLVTGLGDVTLVNIKGENYSEMEDVLQIVVHAILKIKLVNRDLMLEPACIFVHQNVGAVDAHQKMRTGQQKLMETLDKVTKAASIQEDAPEFRKFHEVINFDVNKHIYYISDLWKGDPPMAPANPGYSEKIRLIKDSLLKNTMRQRNTYVTVPKLRLRIGDLWKGILSQNFVFSFRNSITLQAYSSLEAKLSDISFSVGDQALKWLNNKRVVIQRQEKRIGNLRDTLMEEAIRHFKQIQNQEKQNLEAFFEAKEEEELFEQWRAESDLKLKNICSQTLFRTQSRLQEETEIRKLQLELTREAKQYEKKILSDVNSLAEDIRAEQNLNEERLKDKFKESWNEWMLKFPTPFKEVNVYKSVMNALFDAFQQEQPILLQALDVFHRKRIEFNFSACLQNSIIHTKFGQSAPSFLQSSFFSFNMAFTKERSSLLSAQKKVKELQKNISSQANGHCPIEQQAKSQIKPALTLVDKLVRSGINFASVEKFKVEICVYACQLASYEICKYFKAHSQTSSNPEKAMNRIEEIDVHPTFRKVLLQTFPRHHDLVNVALRDCCLLSTRSIGDFELDLKEHVLSNGKCNPIDINVLVQDMLTKIKSDIDETKVQPFRDEHAVRMLRKLHEVIGEAEKKQDKIRFTKKHKAALAVHICMFAIPEFHQRNKMYMEKVDPRNVFERRNKETYFEIFKNHYHQCKNERALANVLSQILCKAMEEKVDKDMSRKLASEVRCNVDKIKRKAVLMPAILQDLLEKNVFDEYYLYLRNVNGCFDKWIKTYVDKYIFHTVEQSSTTRYVELASQEIKTIISRVCQDIDKAMEVTLTFHENDLFSWIKAFLKEIGDKLPLTERDVLNQAETYRDGDPSSFSSFLKDEVNASYARLCQIFGEHKASHLSSKYDESVYSIISRECKGCTEKCPFCSAPCSRSIKDHTKLGVNHAALEHYPKACGKTVWEKSNKLVAENCSVAVASETCFRNAKSKNEWHPYKEYKKLYPDWDIEGDPSLDASPYWKWFLVNFAEPLAEKYKAELPDIPKAWETITIDMARESIKK